MNSTDNENTKMSDELVEDLAQYGITRSKVMEKAPPKANGKANFFGIKEGANGKAELKFTDNVTAIQKDKMIIGMAAPEDKPFDLLVTVDFKKAVKTASPDDLRSYLRNLVKKV